MEYNFSISPRIISHLGEELIKNESIALLELVKNSYDACATYCKIEFITDQAGLLETIIIEDDGRGMNQDLIRSVWLTIGTDYKFRTKDTNECGRFPLGEKGIGRLGIHKLGNKIEMFSKQNDSKESEVSIDWTRLLVAREIEDFKIQIKENDQPLEILAERGTKIIISKLKTSWDRRQIREVHRNLISLNSPFSHSNDVFNVEIRSNSNLFQALPNFDEIKDNAMYTGYCKMVGNKIVDFRYNFTPWQGLEKVDSGRQKALNELLEAELLIADSDGNEIDLEMMGIGPIEFEIQIFETDNQIFSFSNVEKKSVRDYLRENGGIRVYRDNVRVFDYGERDDDWLGIDIRRVKRLGGNVSNNIIIGAVKLSREKSGQLKEKTNREGFIEDEAYFTLVNAVNHALDLIVTERNIDKGLLTNLYKKHRDIEPVLSDLDTLISIVDDRIENNEVKQEINKYLFRINTQYKEVRNVLIKSANAGLNLSVVIHEIDKIISQLAGSIERNETDRSKMLSLRLEKIIRGYSKMIKNSDIRMTSLSQVVDVALDNYSFRFLDHVVKVHSNHLENPLEAFLAESEAISIVTNLLDNSIFWLSFARKENRQLSVFITDQFKGFNSIVISDNGPGFKMPPSIAVKPFMTGKPHNIGSGLGLHVANEMMKDMKGKLLFIDKHDIKFPEQVLANKVDSAIVVLCFPTEKKQT